MLRGHYSPRTSLITVQAVAGLQELLLGQISSDWEHSTEDVLKTFSDLANYWKLP